MYSKHEQWPIARQCIRTLAARPDLNGLEWGLGAGSHPSIAIGDASTKSAAPVRYSTGDWLRRALLMATTAAGGCPSRAAGIRAAI